MHMLLCSCVVAAQHAHVANYIMIITNTLGYVHVHKYVGLHTCTHAMHAILIIEVGHQQALCEFAIEGSSSMNCKRPQTIALSAANCTLKLPIVQAAHVAACEKNGKILVALLAVPAALKVILDEHSAITP